MSTNSFSLPDMEAEADSHVEPQAERKPRTPIVRYDMFFNQRNSRYELRKTHRPVIGEKLRKKRPILVVKRLIDARGQLSGTEIEIHHEGLRNLLLELNDDVKGLDLTTRTPTVDRQLFFHSHTLLEAKLRGLEEASEPRDEDLLEGLYAAARFINEDVRGDIYDFGVLISERQITYEYLWALFRPNTYVHAYDDATQQHYVARARQLVYQQTQEGNFALIECDVVVHDIDGFGVSPIFLRIPRFSGVCSIPELSVYPIEYHPDCDALWQAAVSRGKHYTRLNSPHFYEHHGLATVHIDAEKTMKLAVNERIMVDVASFHEHQPSTKIEFALQVRRRLDPEQMREQDYLICSPVLLGFCFGTKAWGAFAIDRITDVAWSKEPFDRLVLGEKQKVLISALVTQHSSKPTSFDDIVVGKGRGLIGLLCGNPGCGKTLTAEAVAEMTHKPLYAISAGELGTDPDNADFCLRRILRLGERWDAVVLLDEADVFLQERDKTDVSRNALVSIFLRQVEYHTGVLIFTTNLIKDIDPAFESRIHFCVQYPDLDLASRKAVWQTFLSKAGIADKDIDESDLLRLARNPLNGRQIKNTVSTAKSIAAAESSTLAPRHVQTVLEVMHDWHVAKSERTSDVYLILFGAAGVACFYILLGTAGVVLLTDLPAAFWSSFSLFLRNHLSAWHV